MRCRIVTLLAAACSLGFAQAASAADMPVKAPIVKAPLAAPNNWTGFYLGANVGYGWSDDHEAVVGGPDLSQSGHGWLGGGQVGYNWQLNDVVFGVEGDGEAAGIEGSIDCPNPAFSCNHKIDSLFSVRGRLGMTLDPAKQWLVYATGGAGWAHARYQAISGGSTIGGFDISMTQFGWVAGGGVEYMFLPNWSVKGEYLFYDMQGKTGDCSPLPAVGVSSCDFQPNVQTFKVGINWHFH